LDTGAMNGTPEEGREARQREKSEKRKSHKQSRKSENEGSRSNLHSVAGAAENKPMPAHFEGFAGFATAEPWGGAPWPPARPTTTNPGADSARSAGPGSEARPLTGRCASSNGAGNGGDIGKVRSHPARFDDAVLAALEGLPRASLATIIGQITKLRSTAVAEAFLEDGAAALVAPPASVCGLSAAAPRGLSGTAPAPGPSWGGSKLSTLKVPPGGSEATTSTPTSPLVPGAPPSASPAVLPASAPIRGASPRLPTAVPGSWRSPQASPQTQFRRTMVSATPEPTSVPSWNPPVSAAAPAAGAAPPAYLSSPAMAVAVAAAAATPPPVLAQGTQPAITDSPVGWSDVPGKPPEGPWPSSPHFDWPSQWPSQP